MSAYVIVNIAEVRDAGAYARYRQQVSNGVRNAGGRYLVRGGESSVLEGDWRPHRVVVVEFPSSHDARAWWSSEDYASLKQLRQISTRTEMVLVEGVAMEDVP